MITKTLTRNMFALALILLCGHADAAANVNMTNICLLTRRNALLATGNSCTAYYDCFNGVATLQSCPTGLYFNKNLQSCVVQAPDYCSAYNADPCVGHPIGTYVGVPGSCAGFYWCSSNGAKRSNCPSNLVFNPNTQSCAYPTQYPCTETTNAITSTDETVNLCSYMQTGIYFGNAFNCAGWQKCTNDISFVIGTCNDGLVYDAARNLCDYPSNVICSQVTHDPSLDVTSAATGGTCSTIGLVKSATACNQYYQCNGRIWVLQNCVGNLYYNNGTQQCISRMNAINDCDRCVSTVDEFVNAFGTNCTSYLVCKKGVQQSTGVCPSGYFFDEERGGCTESNPQYPFCVATTASTTTATTTPTATITPGATTTPSVTTTPAITEAPGSSTIEANPTTPTVTTTTKP